MAQGLLAVGGLSGMTTPTVDSRPGQDEQGNESNEQPTPS